MKKSFLCLIALASWHNALHPVAISLDETQQTANTKLLKFAIHLNPTEIILKQSIKLSIDAPDMQLSPLQYTPQATTKYLNELKNSKAVFDQDFTINTTLKKTNDQYDTATLHMSMLTLPVGTMLEQTFNISFTAQQLATNIPKAHAISQHQTVTPIKAKQTHKTITEKLEDLVKGAENRWIQLLFAMLLGLLLSLTPCIYPMIPITIGILHSHGKKSMLASFFGSVCYAMGLSTTFAVLGLLAAFAGASFGGLLSQPLFVITITLFIGYMSLSMIGFINLPTPAFMSGGAQFYTKLGPFVAAYIFGLISGTIASPCVSPGLALLLTIVASMGNVFSGFLLLFAFGIGMSIPLIIIGTFSSSLSMMPQAGEWMVEIKKIIGFAMLGMCFYYLNNILPNFVVLWLIVAYLLFAAIFYIIDAQKSSHDTTKTFKSLLGIVLLALSIFTATKAYQETLYKDKVIEKQDGVTWATDYKSGLTQAQKENKKLLVDFWANHCTICKAIEKRIFNKSVVDQGLQDSTVFVKINCTYNDNKDYQLLKDKFKVFAQPTILVIDPNNEQVLQRWSSEPYSMSPEEFVQAVKAIQ